MNQESVSAEALLGATREVEAAFRAHRVTAVAYARRILRDPAAAEDAAQLAFVLILGRVHRGDTRLLQANPEAVVLKATRWAALKLIKTGVLPSDESISAAEDVEDMSTGVNRVEARLVSEQVLRHLPEHYQAALRLRYALDTQDAEAARHMKLSVKAYRRTIDRALAAARRVAGSMGIPPAVGAVALALRRARRAFGCGASRLQAQLSALSRNPDAAGSALNAVAHLAVVATLFAVGSSDITSPGSAGAPSARADAGLWREPGPSPRPPLGVTSSVTVPIGTAAASTQVTPPPAPIPLVPTSPSQTSPEQTMIMNVTPAPAYDENHVIVAQGVGAGCRCQVLLRSEDGGSTWTSALDPVASTTEVLLPPNYPTDPRMLLVSNAACVLASFGSAVCTPLPLLPPVAFDAQFDAGFPVVYGSEIDVGVVALDMATGATHVLVAAPGDAVEIAAPTAATSSTALYVLGPSSSPSGTVGPTTQSSDVVYACARDNSCTPVSSGEASPYLLSVDRQDQAGEVLTALAANGSANVVSVDGGRRFTALTPPDGRRMIALQIAGPLGHLVVWAELTQGGGPGTGSLWRYDVQDGSWAQATTPAGLEPSSFTAVTPSRVLVRTTVGIQCTSDGGTTWRSRCDAA